MEHFNPQTRNIDNDEKRLNEQLNACFKVKTMMETQGWQELVGPWIKRKIGGVLGEELPNGSFKKGKVQNARQDEQREYYIGYLNALMDVYNHIVNHEKAIETKQDALKRIDSQRNQKLRTPMTYGDYSV